MLYTKYRPQTFDTVVGQEITTKILRNAIKTNKIAHSYLFTGPRGTGKTTTARLMVKGVNCLQISEEGDPCNKCSICLAVNKGSFLDAIEVDAASNRGIDQIRELKERIEFRPSIGKYKVYIIDEVHMLTTEAFNALLKTLEEPPRHAIFILATTEPYKLPATILSRCQRYDFRLGTDDDVQKVLQEVLKKEQQTLMPEGLALVTKYARGSYRDALSLLAVVLSAQPENEKTTPISRSQVRAVLGLAEQELTEQFIIKLLTGQSSQAWQILQNVERQGVNIHQFTKDLIITLRDILFYKMESQDLLVPWQDLTVVSIKLIMQVIGWLVEAEEQNKHALIPTLPLELVVLKVREQFVPEEKTVSSSIITLKQDTTPQIVTKSKLEPISSKNQSQESVKNTKPVLSDHADVLPLTQSSTSIDLLQIQEKWQQFMQIIKVQSRGLHAVLLRAEPQAMGLIQGEMVLTLNVPFAFHKERLEDIQLQSKLGVIFQKLWGQAFRVQCQITIKKKQVVSKSIEQPVPENPFIEDVFGEDLVEV